MLALYALVHAITGFIPVFDGAGWDGDAYMRHIQTLAQGGTVDNDPYRVQRLSSLLPALAAGNLGATRQQILLTQATANAALLALSAALFFDTMRALQCRPRTAICAVGALVLNWPYLVMPVYYPMLSDHIAMATAVAALWAWAKRHSGLLYALIFLGVWFMPGLFLMPLILACMPRTADHATVAGQAQQDTSWRIAQTTALVVGLAALAFVLHGMARLDPVGIRNHPVGDAVNGDYALIHLRTLSWLLTGALMFLVVWAATRLLGRPEFWRSIGLGRLVTALAALGCGIASVLWVIDWGVGYRGPPFWTFMQQQAMAAPLKPLVSHLLHFGPVFVVALLLCLADAGRPRPGVPLPLYTLLLAYTPLALLGSESRQWLAVMPAAVALLALQQHGILVWRLYLAFSLLLCAPALWLRRGVADALARGAEYTDPGWQLYFGRQGPWMSIETYAAGLVLALVFLGVYLSARRRFGQA